MAVEEGSDLAYLNKSGSIFSGFVKIKGIAETIYIIDDKGSSWVYFYYYKTSK